MTQNPLQALTPCKHSLLQLAVNHLDESMLRELAAADYSMDQQKHYQALTDICRGLMPAPNSWHPREVLELTRWSEPDKPHHPENAVGHRGHWMRLFACTVLMRNSCEPQGCDIAGDSTLIQLTESAAALGPQVITAAISFLAWYLLEDEEELCRLSAVAILILAVQHKAIDSAASTCLISIIRSDQQEVDEWDRWSIDPKYVFDGNTRKRKWKRLTQEILLAPNQYNSTIRQIAEELLS